MHELTPSQKGAAAEAAFAAAAIQLGLVVLRPLCEGSRYDLVVDLKPALLRVQCKLARRVGGVLVVDLQTCRHTPGGYVHTSYSSDEIDAVAAYSSELSRSFLLPIAEVAGMRSFSLRLESTKNNQARRVKWAEDYALAPMMRGMQAAQHSAEPALGS